MYLGIYTVIQSFPIFSVFLHVCSATAKKPLLCSRCFADMLCAFLYIIYLSKAFNVQMIEWM